MRLNPQREKNLDAKKPKSSRITEFRAQIGPSIEEPTPEIV
jgi:hypothetical protein